MVTDSGWLDGISTIPHIAISHPHYKCIYEWALKSEGIGDCGGVRDGVSTFVSIKTLDSFGETLGHFLAMPVAKEPCIRWALSLTLTKYFFCQNKTKT